MLKRLRESTLREQVEILAIVIAGAWALWVFGWQQWLQPLYFEPPSISLSGTLQELGQRDGYTLVGYRGEVRNTGRTDAAIVATAVTASGTRYGRLVKQFGKEKAPSNFSRYGGGVTVFALYRKILLTSFATGKGQTGLTLDPGESYPIIGNFPVKTRSYDVITLYMSVGYVKHAEQGSEPTKLEFIGPNLIRFVGRTDPDYLPLEEKEFQISI